MKKFFVLVCTAFLSARLFAVGAGIQASFKPSFAIKPETSYPLFSNPEIAGSISATLKLERTPIILATGISINECDNIISYGIYSSFDFYYETQLYNTLNFSFGAGPSIDFIFSPESCFSADAGGRFFFGLNKYFLDGYIEVFVREAVVCKYSLGLNYDRNRLYMDFPTEAGLRFHF